MQLLLRINFLKTTLWVLMEMLPDRNYGVHVTAVLLHDLSMVLEKRSEVRLAWARKLRLFEIWRCSWLSLLTLRGRLFGLI